MTSQKTTHTASTAESNSLIEIESVSIDYETKSGTLHAVRDVNLVIEPGEIYGLAGESGSGKSTLSLALLGALDDNGTVANGRISFKGTDLSTLNARQTREIRGNQIAHCAQDPEKALNPSMKVGKQISEVIAHHKSVSKKEAAEEAIDILADVNIPDPEYNANRYPHELSGGMQQRVAIAIALCCNPNLIILDEPTTGLDVTTQVKILQLVKDLRDEYNTSILLVSHDLGVIAEVADRTAIMYAGEIMEKGGVREIFKNPTNPYTQGLLRAIPEVDTTKDLEAIPGQLPDLHNIPDGCVFADRCEFADDDCLHGTIEEEPVGETHSTKCRRWETAAEDWNTSPVESTITEETDKRPEGTDTEPLLSVNNVKKHFGEESFFDKILGGEPPVQAVDGVDIEIDESETLGLVGESGCGKSTLGETILNLLDVTEGSISYRGQDIGTLSSSDMKEFRSESQIVFQNPDSSLNPQKTIQQILARPLKLFTDLGGDERQTRIAELLDQVGLGGEYAKRYPHELSGGEKQRVAIARAFAVTPSFVVLDEPVSSLDVSVQAAILNLLSYLRNEYGTSYLFISHDIGVVNHISDRIAVMYLGQVAEIGSKQAIFEPPYHPYTQALLSSVPSTDPDQSNNPIKLEGDVPSPREPPTGCPFQTRCPKKIGDICETETPELERVQLSDDENHMIACHLSEEEMKESVPQQDK